ncbi:MAG: hypothetical protein OJF50_005356 [Nitrospira sp.]|jgi:hypothetical protein|nr:hypothetical protein [Nitrospira sp.]
MYSRFNIYIESDLIHRWIGSDTGVSYIYYVVERFRYAVASGSAR